MMVVTTETNMTVTVRQKLLLTVMVEVMAKRRSAPVQS